jgi:hypothetical protein
VAPSPPDHPDRTPHRACRRRSDSEKGSRAGERAMGGYPAFRPENATTTAACRGTGRPSVASTGAPRTSRSGNLRGHRCGDKGELNDCGGEGNRMDVTGVGMTRTISTTHRGDRPHGRFENLRAARFLSCSPLTIPALDGARRALGILNSIPTPGPVMKQDDARPMGGLGSVPSRSTGVLPRPPRCDTPADRYASHPVPGMRTPGEMAVHRLRIGRAGQSHRRAKGPDHCRRGLRGEGGGGARRKAEIVHSPAVFRARRPRS